MHIKSLSVLMAAALIAGSTNAGSLVYTPVNPSFGGSPLNGSVQLNNAESQNNYQDPDLNDEVNALDDFNDRLQRALLTRLTRAVTSQIVDEEGNLIPGETETTDFIILVQEEDEGTLSVTTTDKVTGGQTKFTVEAGTGF